MQISLRNFLLHGRLGTFAVGMSVAEMLSIFGKPNNVSGLRRKTRRPQIYKYGDFEINISINNPDITCGFYVECPLDGTAIRFPKAVTEIEWPLLKRCKRISVEDCLRNESIPFEDRSDLNGLRILQSGAIIGLENDCLYSLWCGVQNG